VVLVVIVGALAALAVATIGSARDEVRPLTASPTPAEPVPVVLAAGDIARCQDDADERVAELLDDLEGIVITLGDSAYPSGRPEDYEECYGPSWGRHRVRTRPALGNHDYETPGAAGYFSYFGRQAGDPGKGYYAYPLGTRWRAIVLNSNCEHVPGGCEEGSPQVEWLREELAAHPDKNILAYWHHALYSSGDHGGSDRAQVFWEVLQEAGVDLVLVAHDHNYERLAPLDAKGDPAPLGGIRQFVVGTGGGTLRPFPGPALPATEARDDATHGVLRVELHPESYRWEFLPAAPGTFRDSGSSPVNPPPSG
jgi:acid phosphatase type 7